MFYNASRFPFTEKLEDKWNTVLAEYQNLKSGTIPYPETDLYIGKWDVFPFIFLGEIFIDNCKKCPKTWSLLENIPGINTASFSILRPGTDIGPHTGFSNKVLRCHLGLVTPSNCLLMVGGQEKEWKEGKILIFDDTVEHEAYNHNEREDRVVLLIDINKNEYPNAVS